jgi:glycosyltransferase involved in cell wall biosynthesis
VAGVRDRILAIVIARNEEAALGPVLSGLPTSAGGRPVDVLVVDDGSRDRTPEIAQAAGAALISHPATRGSGAALRTGLDRARALGYTVAVHLDGDGEYDPSQLERLVAPIVRGESEYVLGSRFRGERDGMSWHRSLANRAASGVVGALIGATMTDAQTGYRAFGPRALARAEIGHDYNSAQVVTLSLWGAGIRPIEVPISYRRRAAGRSFVRYPEYVRRVAPAVWRAWLAALRARAGRS